MGIPRELIKHLEGRAPGRYVIAALQKLLTDDVYLLKVDANERSISHRFGMHLQQRFTDYSVDCEYNRDGLDPKRIGHLDLQPRADDTEGKTVFPDIVVHIRGEKQNYLVIELKKSSNKVSRDVDFQKLSGYKSDDRLKYEYALFIELTVGSHPGVARAQWVEN